MDLLVGMFSQLLFPRSTMHFERLQFTSPHLKPLIKKYLLSHEWRCRDVLQGFDIFLFGTTAEKSSVNIRAINPDFCLCPRAIGEQKNHNTHSGVAFQQSSLLPQSPLWWTLSFLLFLLTKNGHHCFVRPLNKPRKKSHNMHSKRFKYLKISVTNQHNYETIFNISMYHALRMF